MVSKSAKKSLGDEATKRVRRRGGAGKKKQRIAGRSATNSEVLVHGPSDENKEGDHSGGDLRTRKAQLRKRKEQRQVRESTWIDDPTAIPIVSSILPFMAIQTEVTCSAETRRRESDRSSRTLDATPPRVSLFSTHQRFRPTATGSARQTPWGR
jgi:hypothetical protein